MLTRIYGCGTNGYSLFYDGRRGLSRRCGPGWTTCFERYKEEYTMLFEAASHHRKSDKLIRFFRQRILYSILFESATSCQQNGCGPTASQ